MDLMGDPLGALRQMRYHFLKEVKQERARHAESEEFWRRHGVPFEWCVHRERYDEACLLCSGGPYVEALARAKEVQDAAMFRGQVSALGLALVSQIVGITEADLASLRKHLNLWTAEPVREVLEG